MGVIVNETELQDITHRLYKWNSWQESTDVPCIIGQKIKIEDRSSVPAYSHSLWTEESHSPVSPYKKDKR
jgi:hypothetical protein